MEQDIYSDGSDHMERMLLFAFLAESSGCEFREQLPFLHSQGIFYSVKDVQAYDSDGELQTDGNRSGHLQNGDLVLEPEVNEEIFRTIAAQLAEIGDQLDKQIEAKVVNDLVQHFLNENLPIEEITRCLSQAVQGLARAIPSDLEQEKAMLVLAMLLTKKVANRVPSLLQRVFSTTVNYISQHLHNYVVRMVSAIQQLCSSVQVAASLFAGPGYSLRAQPDAYWSSHDAWGSGGSVGKCCWYLQAQKADVQREGG
uniref:BH3-interacting domain death agonist n=1 Tax=Pavo cristatus TaxID=9049 RepID=A0A8C9LCF9_PAVCR